MYTVLCEGGIKLPLGSQNDTKSMVGTSLSITKMSCQR